MNKLHLSSTLVVSALVASASLLSQERAPNILLIIGDDIGVEQVSAFGIGPEPARTPNLDALAARGMRFSRVWAQPMCSPTRATLLAGRYGFRTGVGSGVGGPGMTGPYPDDPVPGPAALTEVNEVLETDVTPYIGVYNGDPGNPRISVGLRLDEAALPAQLKLSRAAEYSTAAIGKWHLADLDGGWLEHPGRIGFDHFSVLMRNEPESYFAWWENVNGTLEERHGYTPARKIDDALAWIGEQREQPWFLWLAFNLPHFPQHIPEVPGLDTSGLSPSDPHAALDAMIARMDYEIGRLLDGIGNEALENTIVAFVGDNGTTGKSIDPPFHPERAKFMIYEGGLRVPLIIAGPGIPEGAATDALVNTTDIYSTLLDLADAPIPHDRTLDAESLVPYFDDPSRPPLRTWIYAEHFMTNQGIALGGHTIRDDRYKLVRIRERTELYDLDADPSESRNLLGDGISDGEQRVLDRLQETVTALHDSEKMPED